VSARRLLVLRGTPDETAAAAAARLAAFPEVATRAPLGGEVEALVVSLHEGLDPDALGRAVGAVRGGGVLALRLPPEGPPPWAALAVWPHGPADVGRRLGDRLLRSLADLPDPGPLRPAGFHAAGSPEQTALAATLSRAAPGARDVVTGGRGRGKSTAVGLAAAAWGGRTVVTSVEPEHSATLRARAGLPWTDPWAFGEGADTVVVDEAGAMPVPLLVRLVERHPGARFVFATTVHGYEGTGRGFVHRFLPWLRARGPVREHVLEAPVRWDPGDPVERWADALLLLDARRAPATGRAPWTVERLLPDRLAAAEALLRDVFGLLVEAHYRTTPADLARVLDAPNLAVHAALAGGRVVGVALRALEGGLPDALLDRLAAGERLRGHALPETLVSHSGAREGGGLRWVRSVRLATEADRRGEGVAAALVRHVEASEDVDGYGTLFGATAALVRFRRSLGYAVVRLSASRGARSGEPSVVMLRARSPAAAALVARLRADLARDLPAQLALAAADGGAPLDPALVDQLTADLPAPAPVDPGAVAAFLRGRPHEAAVSALEALVAAADLGALDPADRALVVGRVAERRAWTALVPPAEVPAAMRRLRRAIAALVERRGSFGT
jgi:tRNA(Met) cytidine acetyltransferase